MSSKRGVTWREEPAARNQCEERGSDHGTNVVLGHELGRNVHVRQVRSSRPGDVWCTKHVLGWGDSLLAVSALEKV